MVWSHFVTGGYCLDAGASLLPNSCCGVFSLVSIYPLLLHWITFILNSNSKLHYIMFMYYWILRECLFVCLFSCCHMHLGIFSVFSHLSCSLSCQPNKPGCWFKPFFSTDGMSITSLWVLQHCCHALLVSRLLWNKYWNTSVVVS